MPACGLDFGTSNSALGVIKNGRPTLVPLEGGETLLPSAIFFDFERKGMPVFGAAAIAASIAEHEGRLMRALKTILGSPLIDEATAIGSRRVKLVDVVEYFIRHMKQRGEAFAGHELTQVVHGRPVRFVDGDDEADTRAQNVLENIARRAGFRDVHFVFEPLAAAYHYEETVTDEELVLIADIGGGTSDFTVIRIGPDRRARVNRQDDILANSGVRIGGTDFDTSLNLNTVMPLLGMGTQLTQKDLPMPKSTYFDLATWATINFTYTYQTEREVADLWKIAVEPDKVGRLHKTIRNHLGHRIAFAVEDAKIALSEQQMADIPLHFLEPELHAPATQIGFEHAITDRSRKLSLVAAQCVRDAGLKAEDIQTVFLTGGSSRVPAVRKAIAKAAPNARVTSGSDMLSVASGLTREAARRFR